MREIYVVICPVDGILQIQVAFLSREEAIKYIEEYFPSYVYDAFNDVWWALDMNEGYISIVKTALKFIA